MVEHFSRMARHMARGSKLLLGPIILAMTASPGVASTSCLFGGGVLTLTLSTTTAPVSVVRSDAPTIGEIRVLEAGVPVPCAQPPPTVSTVELIRVSDPTRRSAILEIDLRGGLFGSVEFMLDLGEGTSDELRIVGSDGADHLVLSGSGIDLDGGGQVDVRTTGVEIHAVEAGAGNDIVDAGGDDNSGPFPARLVIDGGPGADTIDGGDAGDLLRGGDGPDVLRGWDGPDRLEGGEGADDLDGGPRDDVLVGGPGNDVEKGGSGDDLFLQGSEPDGGDAISGGIGDLDVVAYDRRSARVEVRVGNGLADDGEAGELDAIQGDVEGVLGGSGDDLLIGHGAANLLRGGPGDDELEGQGGPDVLDGGPGTNTLDGGAASDTVTYADASGPVTVDLELGVATGAGEDTLASVENAIGGPFGDTLIGTAEADDLRGRGGADRLVGQDGPDVLLGGTGADVLEGGPGSDELDGGAGNDRLRPGGGADVVEGGPGRDLLDLASSLVPVVVDLPAGTLVGEGEAIVSAIEDVRGSRGDDVLRGDRFPNRLSGLAGRDVVSGAGGADVLSGGTGDDVLVGGSGADLIDEGAAVNGADRIRGGPGRDTVSYRRRTRDLRVSVGRGADDGERFERDLIAASVERVLGGRGRDLLVGDRGPNVLVGGDGHDRLRGKGGDDLLIGGPGRDLLDGGPGFDRCRQGPGKGRKRRCEA